MARFKVGDVVRCVTNQYSSIRRGETRTVLEVIDAEKWELLKLPNPHSPYRGTSNYTALNFELVHRPETTPMYERTKFFAVKLDPSKEQGSIHPGGFLLDTFNTTTLRDTRHQTQVDVGRLIKEGERWIVCQTVMMIEGEEPRPPMKITEYK